MLCCKNWQGGRGVGVLPIIDQMGRLILKVQRVGVLQVEI